MADVALCIRTAREHDLLLAVRGGGHNVAGFGTCDGGLVCDLGAMRAVRVDPSRGARPCRAARRGPTSTPRRRPSGSPRPAASSSSTGVGGLTLGGGIGWLKRHHGLTCDNLLGADVLTADGTLVRASADENPDLFRALRGGGGNFGIVTSFEFALHEVDTVIGGYLAFEIERLGELLRWYREAAPGFPRELTTLLFIMSAEAKAPMPERLWGRPVMLLGACWSGDPRAGERVLAQLRAAGARGRRRARSRSATSISSRRSSMRPRRSPATATTGRPSTSRACPTRRSRRSSSTSAAPPRRISYMEIDPLGGAIAEVGEDETAIGFRHAPFLYQSNAVWEPGDPERERHVAWARDFFAAMTPFSAGATYLNFIGEEGERARARRLRACRLGLARSRPSAASIRATCSASTRTSRRERDPRRSGDAAAAARREPAGRTMTA